MTLLRAFALALVVLVIAVVACLAIAGQAVAMDYRAGFSLLSLLIFLLPALMALLKGHR